MARPIIIRIDASGAISGGKQAEAAFTGVRRGAGQLRDDTSRMNRALGETRQSFRVSAQAAQRLQQAFTLLAGALAVRQLISYSDAWTQITGRLRTATETQEELIRVQERVFQIAQQTRAPLAETATLYARLSNAAEDLGATQGEIARVVETVNKSLVINGTSTQAAAGALLQLSQALGGARIQAQEYNSLIDGARPLLQAVANGLDEAGGSVNRLTALVREGKVSGEDFFRAILAGGEGIDDVFGQIDTTVASAFTVLQNSLTQFIGRINESAGATATLSEGLLTLSRAIDAVDVDALAVRFLNVTRAIARFGQAIEEVFRFLQNPPRQIAEALGITEREAGLFDRFIAKNQELVQQLEESRKATSQLNALFDQFRAQESLTEEETQRLTNAFERYTGLGGRLSTANRELATSLGLYVEEVGAGAEKTGELATAQEAALSVAERLTAAYQKEQQSLQDLIVVRTQQAQGLIDETEARLQLQRSQDERQFGAVRAQVLDEQRRALAALDEQIQQNIESEEEYSRLLNEGHEAAVARVQAHISTAEAAQQEAEHTQQLTAIIHAGIASGAEYAEITRELAIAEKEAALTAAGLTENITETATASVDATRELEKANTALQKLNETGISIDLARVFDQALEGIILGTRDLSEIFEALGTSLAVDFGRSFLFGKERSFDIPFGANVLGLVGDRGLIGDLFGKGGGIASNLFGEGFASAFRVDSNLITGGIEAALGGDVVPGILTAFEGLGHLGAGAFGIAFGAGIGQLFGIGGSGVGATIGGIGGGIAGATLLSSLGPFGTAIGAALGSFIGGGLEEAFSAIFGSTGRIRQELKDIEEFFESATGLRAHATFTREAAESTEELENALHGLGVAYANLSDGGLGTIKRFANLATAAFDRHNLTLEESQAVVLQLADAMGLDLKGAIDELNIAFDELRGKAGDFTLAELVEERREGQSDIILAADALEGLIQVFSGFSPAIDAARIANAALADSFVAIAQGAELAIADYQLLADQIRAGSLEIEDALLMLNERFGTAFDLGDIDIDAATVSDAVERILTEVEIVAVSAGETIARAVSEGLESSTDISEAFIEAVRAALFDQAVAQFLEDNLPAILESFDFTEPIDLSSAAFQELAQRVETAGLELEKILHTLGLIKDTSDSITPPNVIPPELQSDIDTFIGGAPVVPLGLVGELRTAREEFDNLRNSTRDLFIAAARAGEDTTELSNSLDMLDDAMRRTTADIVRRGLEQGDTLIESFFPPTFAQEQEAFNESLDEQRETLRGLREEGRLTTAELAAIDAQLERLDLAEALFPLQGFVAELNALPANLSTQIADLFKQAFRDADFDIGQVDFTSLEQQAQSLVANAVFDAVINAVTEAFVLAPIQAIIGPAFAAAGAAIAAGGVAAAGAVAAATQVLADLIDVLPELFAVMEEFFSSEEFLRLLDIVGGASGAGSSSGRTGITGAAAGGGGGGGGGVQQGADALEQALDAIREFGRANIGEDVASQLRNLQADATDLLTDLIDAIFTGPEGFLNRALLHPFNDPRFNTGLQPSALQQRQEVLNTLSQGLVDIIDGMTNQLEEIFRNQLQPAQQFFESTRSDNALTSLTRDYQEAREALSTLGEILGDTVDLTDAYAAITETLQQRIAELVTETLQPFADRIKELIAAPLQSLDSILTALTSAKTLSDIEALQDAVLAVFEADLAARQAKLEKATEAAIGLIEEQLATELDAIQKAHDAQINTIQALITALEDLGEFLTNLPDALEETRRQILGITQPFEEILKEITNIEDAATAATNLQRLLREGTQAILTSLQTAIRTAERLSAERIRILEEESRITIQTLRSESSARIQTLRDEHILQRDELETRISLIEELIQLQQQEITARRAALQQQIEGARRLREQLFDATILGPSGGATLTERFASGFQELTRLGQRLLSERGTADDLARFQELIAPLREINQQLFAGTKRGIAQEELLNTLIREVAVGLERSANTQLQQLGGVAGTNERLDRIREIQQLLRVNAETGITKLEALRSQTEQNLITLAEKLTATIEAEETALIAAIEAEEVTLAAAIKAEEEVLQREIEELRLAAEKQLVLLENALTTQTIQLLESIDPLSRLEMEIAQLEQVLAQEQAATRAVFQTRIDKLNADLAKNIAALSRDLGMELQIISDTFADKITELAQQSVDVGTEISQDIFDLLDGPFLAIQERMATTLTKMLTGAGLGTHAILGALEDIPNTFGVIQIVGQGIADLDKSLSEVLSNLGNTALQAHGGLHGVVKAQAVPIIAHRGERVDISPQNQSHGDTFNITISTTGKMETPRQFAEQIITEIERRRTNREIR